nr:hypothetical protein [uncultured Ruegeria sp.]
MSNVAPISTRSWHDLALSVRLWLHCLRIFQQRLPEPQIKDPGTVTQMRTAIPVLPAEKIRAAELKRPVQVVVQKPQEEELPVVNSQVVNSPVVNSPVASSQVVSSRVVNSPVVNSQVASSPVVKSQVVNSQAVKSQVVKSQAVKSQVAKKNQLEEPRKLRSDVRV